MKQFLILTALVSVSFMAQSQSNGQNKDSAYKYYILVNRHISENTNAEWGFFTDQYYKFRTACLKECRTYADSLRYMSDMTDSLQRYKSKKVHS